LIDENQWTQHAFHGSFLCYSGIYMNKFARELKECITQSWELLLQLPSTELELARNFQRALLTLNSTLPEGVENLGLEAYWGLSGKAHDLRGYFYRDVDNQIMEWLQDCNLVKTLRTRICSLGRIKTTQLTFLHFMRKFLGTKTLLILPQMAKFTQPLQRLQAPLDLSVLSWFLSAEEAIQRSFAERLTMYENLIDDFIYKWNKNLSKVVHSEVNMVCLLESLQAVDGTTIFPYIGCSLASCYQCWHFISVCASFWSNRYIDLFLLASD